MSQVIHTAHHATIMAAVIASLAILLVAPVLAQEADSAARTTAPANSAAQAADANEAATAAALEAEVIEVAGTVTRTMTPDDAASWVDAKVGDKLPRHAWIRTGLGSSCVLKFADRGEVTVKSLTKSGIGQFFKSGDTVRAEVGVKYGAIDVEVDSSKGETDMRARLAESVVALRGSKVAVGTSEMGPGFRQSTGHGQLTYGNGLSRWLRPGTKQTDGNQTPGELASNALSTWVGDVTGGLTPAEQQVLNDYLTGGNFNNTLGGFGSVPQTSSTPSSIISGYTHPFQMAEFTGSGTFTDPDWSSTAGSGGYGTWIGSGTFSLEGLYGSWSGAGAWTGVVGSPAAHVKSFAGSGTWYLDDRTGTFVIAGTAGPPDGAHTTTDQGNMTWSAYGPAKIIRSTQSP